MSETNTPPDELPITPAEEFRKYAERTLVKLSLQPEHFAELTAEEHDVTKKDVLEFVRKEFSLTESPGRRSFEYCLRCNPHLNGVDGKDGTEAIAKHYVPDKTGVEQYRTGWEGLCRDCVLTIKENDETTIKPLPGYEDHDVMSDIMEEDKEVAHECPDPSWRKLSLVTENEMFDWVECEDCGIQAKRYGYAEDIEVIGYNAR